MHAELIESRTRTRARDAVPRQTLSRHGAYSDKPPNLPTYLPTYTTFRRRYRRKLIYTQVLQRAIIARADIVALCTRRRDVYVELIANCDRVIIKLCNSVRPRLFCNVRLSYTKVKQTSPRIDNSAACRFKKERIIE